MASAAILTGGSARRFDGRDKGALRVGGRTILERQIDVLTPLTDDIMAIGRPSPAAHLRHVVERHPGLGPLAGLEAALETARDDRVLLLACDLPFLTTPFLAHLLDVTADADAVVPRTDRGYHPLCAVYDRRCLDAVRRRLAARDLALKWLLSDVHVVEIPAETLARFGPQQRLLANVNTQADLDEAETLLNHEL